MRILLVNDSLLKIGGAESHFWQLHDLLCEQGFEVECFGVKAPENFNSWFSRWWSFKYAAAIGRKIDEFKPDVVHYHNVFRCLSPSVVYAARSKGVRTLLTVHDPNLLTYSLRPVCGSQTLRKINGVVAQHFLPHGIFNFLIKFPLLLVQRLKCKVHAIFFERYVDLFIFPSKMLLQLHLQLLKFDPKKCFELPYFVDAGWLNAAQDLCDRREQVPQTSSKRVLFIGRFIKDKGAHILMEAFSQVVQDSPELSLHLVLVGDGVERTQLMAQARELGISDCVEFLGALSAADVQNQLAKADLVVVPSLWLENYPMVAIEAQIFSKPLIVSNIGGLPEVVAGYSQAYVFEPGDIVALSQVIKRALNTVANNEVAAPSLMDGQKFIEIYRGLLKEVISS
jgi:glycosyltransferase involved in cell wall biosynthesis